MFMVIAKGQPVQHMHRNDDWLTGGLIYSNKYIHVVVDDQ